MSEHLLHAASTEQLLLKAGQAQERLGVSRGQFSKLQPYLLSLVFAGVTYRFSAGYINELQWAMGSDSARYIRPVCEFAARPATAGIIAEEVAVVRNALQSALAPEPMEQYIPAPDLRKIAQVGRVTLFDWRKEGLIHTFTPRGHHPSMHVSVASLNTICEWRYPMPQGFDTGVQVI